MEDQRVMSKWEIDILLNDHVNKEPVTIYVLGDEDGYTTGICIKTRNGLKHYGDRIIEPDIQQG